MDRLKQRFLRAGLGWAEDNIPRLAAAFSFFTVLSLAPLLVLAVVAGGYFLGETQTLEKLIDEARGYVGVEGADLIRSFMASAKRPTASTIATVASLLVTFFSASNLFMSLVDSMNYVWGIRPTGSVVKSLIGMRFMAFLSVLVFSLLFLGWLALDAWLNWLERNTIGFVSWHWVSLGTTVLFLSTAFAVSYTQLPKGRVTLRQAAIPALVTALGVTFSKYLLSLYFTYAGTSSAYGPAGALVVILLWIFYMAQIYFFGAEMCYVTVMEGREGEMAQKHVMKAPPESA
jgi:membrane protein